MRHANGFTRAALIVLLALLPLAAGHGQVADDITSLELLDLVVNPTAGTLKQGQYGIDVRAYGEGGLLAGVSVGLFHRFMFGVSYGGERLLGYRDPVGNELPGVIVKYRLIEESMSLPALTFGFQMQGQGMWDTDAERYLYKAPGGFAVLSRNWTSNFGRFGAHAGVNFNAIEDKNERGWDWFAGVDFSLNDQLVLLAEYDLALDDNKADDGFGEGDYGYLNAGARFAFAQSLAIQVDFYDLLNTSAETSGIGRSIKLIYVERFTL